MIDREIFACNLCRYMEEKSVSIAEIAELTLARKTQVKHWMSGEVTPRWGNVVLIADRLGVSTADLLRNKDS